MSIGESDVGSINYLGMSVHNKVPINIHIYCKHMVYFHHIKKLESRFLTFTYSMMVIKPSY